MHEKNLNVEKSEKIQVILDNLTLKFPSKHILDKLVEYINFESSNKFTLIFNHNNTNSRPNTRGTNRSDSPTVRKVSGSKAVNTNNQTSQQSSNSSNKNSESSANKKKDKKSATNESVRSKSNENKSSKSSIANDHIDNLNESLMNDTLNSNNNEMIEEVLNKVSFPKRFSYILFSICFNIFIILRS